MKQLIRFSVITVFIVLTMNEIQAQVRFGPRVGVNFSTMTLKTGGISFDPASMTGFQVGVISEISLGNNFALQPGFVYSAKGSSFNLPQLTVNMEIKPNYLEAPVNILFKIVAGPAKVILMAGPYFGYGIGGSTSYIVGQTTVDEALKFGSGLENDLKPFDMGLTVGGGVEISHFQLALQYELGLLNLTPITDNDSEQKNKVITISLAYLFGVK